MATLGSAEPLSPQAALQAFRLHPGYRIELVAAEPDVIDPVHIAFDAAARLWVVEYSDYPHGPAEGAPGLSRIRVLTDPDGDGRYSAPVTFADKLIFATGLVPWRDGVIVTTAGSVLFLRDSDGDGRADESQEWFTGFKQENPQLRANHPTLALDNHVYIASGLRGGEVGPGRDWKTAFGKPPEAPLPEPVSLSGRDFRFDPLTGAFEAVSGPGQFGLACDDWGRRFVCDNRHPCKQLLLEESDLRRNPHVTVTQTFEDVLPAGEESRLYPLSRTWTTSNLHANQFTAACGLCIYRGDALPGLTGNAFVCDPTANLVHRAVLEPRGATFTSHVEHPGTEFLATTDEWCRPVNLATGPDGALYVVDMYRAVIEHPQFMPEELKNRPDLLLGTDRGRIYRIIAADGIGMRPVSAPRPSATSSLPELAEFLSHPCAWQRETAQRLWLERWDGSPDGVHVLQSLLNDRSPLARAHALRLLSRFGQLTSGQLITALKDASLPRVQELAARIAGEPEAVPAESVSALQETAAATQDPQVQFAALLALAGAGADVDLSPLLADLALRAADDPWRLTAIQLAAHQPAGVTTLLVHRLGRMAGGPQADLPAGAGALLQRFTLQTARQGNTADVVRCLSELAASFPEPHNLAATAVLGLCAGLRAQRQPVLAQLEQTPPETRVWLQRLFQWARETAQRPSAAAAAQGVALLEYAPWTEAAVLLEVARSHPELQGRKQALEVLGRRSEPEITPLLTGDLASLTPELRTVAISGIFASPDRIKRLLDELEAERYSPRLIDPARIKQLTTHRDMAIRARAAKIFADATPEARRQVLANYASALSLTADPSRGQEVFKANCITCHRIGGLGVDVAPDISDTRTKTREYLLTSILDPNQAIDNNYFSYTLIDRDGLVHTGVIATETATSVTLKQPEGKLVTVAREEIEELKSTGVSLMPEGLERNINVQQMADLLSFLKNWRYLDGSVPPDVIR